MDNNEQQSAPTSSTPSTPAPANVDNSTLMAVLAYLGPLVIIPFLTAKDQPFVKFHVKQGLVLFALEVLLWIVGGMVMWGPLWPIVNLLNLGLIVLTIIGIVNVVQKKEAELPLVGSFAHSFNI